MAPPAAKTKKNSQSQPKSNVHRRHLTTLDVDIEYQAHDDFKKLSSAQARALPEGQSLYSSAPRQPAPKATIDSLTAYYQTRPLLSPEGERHLFRKLNFLKYQAAELDRRSARSNTLTPAVRQEISDLLEDADAARNHIAECNLRLVVSIAKKFATSTQEFEELISEGNMILLKAIDKFDFSRGFRFSTYATHSVQRHIYRWTDRKQRRRKSESTVPVDMLSSMPETLSDDQIALDDPRLATIDRQLGQCLDEREQFILRQRFGIGARSGGRTLRDIAADIGLSKERVRQIQVAALEKLQEFLGSPEAEPASA